MKPCRLRRQQTAERQRGRNLAVNDAWLEQLAGVTTLELLSLANCDVHGPGLRHIAGLTNLERLNLTLAPATDDHLVHLAGLAELQSLSLASGQCNGTGFVHLRPLAVGQSSASRWRSRESSAGTPPASVVLAIEGTVGLLATLGLAMFWPLVSS